MNDLNLCGLCGMAGRVHAPSCPNRPLIGMPNITAEFNAPKNMYDTLRSVLDMAERQASEGKGQARHAVAGEAFEDQQIVKFGLWLGNNGFQIGQACKKALESQRLGKDMAIHELLGAIVYLAAAVMVRERLP